MYFRTGHSARSKGGNTRTSCLAPHKKIQRTTQENTEIHYHLLHTWNLLNIIFPKGLAFNLCSSATNSLHICVLILILATFHKDSKTRDPCLEQAMSEKHFCQNRKSMYVAFWTTFNMMWDVLLSQLWYIYHNEGFPRLHYTEGNTVCTVWVTHMHEVSVSSF